MMGTYDPEERRKGKMHSDKRIISLQPIEGKKTLSSTGMVDPRLFTGENQLIAQFDDNTGMWFLRYAMGATPATLNQKFTRFSELKDFVTSYYRTRNVEISGIQD